MTTSEKKKRTLQELNNVGITGFGAQRQEARNLYKLLHDDEHIMAAIRGRFEGDGAMFVATNKRMLLLNYKPLFNNNKEITYAVLAGVSFNPQQPIAGITIHTRMGNFNFRYVKRDNARRLTEYLEKFHLEQSGETLSMEDDPAVSPRKRSTHTFISKPAHIFLASHNIGVLSTLTKEGNVSGAAVYYVITPENVIYMVTKSNTNKAKNLQVNQSAAFTVYDEAVRATVQIQGEAVFEKDQKKAEETLHKIIRPHLYNKDVNWPPITQLAAGGYLVVSLHPSHIKFTDFNK